MITGAGGIGAAVARRLTGPCKPDRAGAAQLVRATANADADELLALIGNAGALGWDPRWKAHERALTAAKAHLGSLPAEPPAARTMLRSSPATGDRPPP